VVHRHHATLPPVDPTMRASFWDRRWRSRWHFAACPVGAGPSLVRQYSRRASRMAQTGSVDPRRCFLTCNLRCRCRTACFDRLRGICARIRRPVATAQGEFSDTAVIYAILLSVALRIGTPRPTNARLEMMVSGPRGARGRMPSLVPVT